MLFVLITLTASKQKPKACSARCLQDTFARGLDFLSASVMTPKSLYSWKYSSLVANLYSVKLCFSTGEWKRSLKI